MSPEIRACCGSRRRENRGRPCRRCCNGLAVRDPVGVYEPVTLSQGVVQEPGRPCLLRPWVPAGIRDNNFQALVWCRLSGEGANNQVRGAVPLTEQNEVRGMGDRESERLIVPVKLGNRTRRDPGEGSGRLGVEPVGGTDDGGADLYKHLNTTFADS
jgi:hypothetical protein